VNRQKFSTIVDPIIQSDFYGKVRESGLKVCEAVEQAFGQWKPKKAKKAKE